MLSMTLIYIVIKIGRHKFLSARCLIKGLSLVWKRLLIDYVWMHKIHNLQLETVKNKRSDCKAAGNLCHETHYFKVTLLLVMKLPFESSAANKHYEIGFNQVRF